MEPSLVRESWWKSEAWWHDFLAEIAAKIARKMNIGDALILREAEN
jgi:hypothetical protein